MLALIAVPVALLLALATVSFLLLDEPTAAAVCVALFIVLSWSGATTVDGVDYLGYPEYGIGGGRDPDAEPYYGPGNG